MQRDGLWDAIEKMKAPKDLISLGSIKWLSSARSKIRNGRRRLFTFCQNCGNQATSSLFCVVSLPSSLSGAIWARGNEKMGREYFRAQPEDEVKVDPRARRIKTGSRHTKWCGWRESCSSFRFRAVAIHAQRAMFSPRERRESLNA